MKAKRRPLTAADLTAYINSQPALLSLLYDIDLLPEQVRNNQSSYRMMQTVVLAFKAGREAESKTNPTPTT